MAINGAVAKGDDQKWKLEAEKKIAKLERDVAELKSQLGVLTGRGK